MAKRKTIPGAERQALFVQEYLKDLNATQAAIRAGYSAKTAAAQGSRLLKNVNVRAAIDAALARVAKSNDITVERTLQEIARIAYGDMRKLFKEDGTLRNLSELDDDSAALIASIETDTISRGSGEDSEPIVTVTRKVKRWDKVKALDQCMAYLGMHKTANPAEGGGLALTINLSGGKRVR